MSRAGLWINFDGGEGAGKTTQIKRLVEAFLAHGIHVVQTREPGATVLGSEIRRLLLQTDGDEPVLRAEALLFAADRAQHVAKVVYPALMEDKIVVQDRGIGSTLAFQSGGGGLNYDQILNLSLWGMNGIRPHMTFYLDIDPEVGLRRSYSAGNGNRMENKGIEYHRAVRRVFKMQAQARDWFEIDGSLPPDVVHEKIFDLAMTEAALFGHEPRELEN